ncbi:MAG: ribonuclease HII [Pseudomonadota bacterium]
MTGAEDGRVAGTDEAGRGPLAGAVVAAAVILDPERPIAGLADSKTLSAKRRDALFDQVCERALAWHIAEASVAEIDQLNILHASMLAMQRAVSGLQPAAEAVLVDGNRCPALAVPSRAVVGGDGSVPAIAAASILAKVARDRQMRELDLRYPDYGFAAHKGYPTAHHRDVLMRLGPCPAHRRSFAPVQRAEAAARAVY